MTGILPITASGGIVVRDGAGLATNPPNVFNAHVPAATFTSSCQLTALPSDCTARFSPAQINAIVSELLCLAEAFDPDGNWDCTSLCNLSTAWNNWLADMDVVSTDAGNLISAGTDGGALLNAAAIATGICADNAAGDALAACLVSVDAGNALVAGADGRLYTPPESLTALAYNTLTTELTYTDENGNATTISLAALTTDIYVNGASFNPATLVLTLTDNSGTTPDVTVNLAALLGVSTDADNILSNGTDGKPYLSADGTVTAICADDSAGDALATCLRSTDAGNALVLGTDGRLGTFPLFPNLYSYAMYSGATPLPATIDGAAVTGGTAGQTWTLSGNEIPSTLADCSFALYQRTA